MRGNAQIEYPPPVELENNNSNTLLVFQSPGKDEWRVGAAIQPTIKRGGSAGRRIELSWSRCNKKRSDFDIVNTVQCYPGNQGGRDFSPDFKAISFCSKRLECIIRTKSYHKIIGFGVIAYNAIFAICNGQSAVNVIRAKHPSGGVSNDKLDDLW